MRALVIALLPTEQSSANRGFRFDFPWVKSEQKVSLKKPIKLVIECDAEQKKRIESVLGDVKSTNNATELNFGKGDIAIENSNIRLGIILVEEAAN